MGYWLMLSCIPVSGYGAGVLTPEGNFAAYIDRLLLPGKLHRKVYDPEGLLSTIPAIVTALSGIFTGQFLLASLSTQKRKVLVLVVTGIICIAIGLLWGKLLPINKNMWTSSFVLLTSGCSLLLFSLFFILIDIAGIRTVVKPFIWMGSNSILIYMAAHGIINFEHTSNFIFGGLIHAFNPIWQSVLIWVGVAVIQFYALYLLHKRQWFLKI